MLPNRIIHKKLTKGGEPLNGHFKVELNKFQLNGKLIGDDWNGDEEGVLSITVAGHPTTIYWGGNTQKHLIYNFGGYNEGQSTVAVLGPVSKLVSDVKNFQELEHNLDFIEKFSNTEGDMRRAVETEAEKLQKKGFGNVLKIFITGKMQGQARYGDFNRNPYNKIIQDALDNVRKYVEESLIDNILNSLSEKRYNAHTSKTNFVYYEVLPEALTKGLAGIQEYKNIALTQLEAEISNHKSKKFKKAKDAIEHFSKNVTKGLEDIINRCFKDRHIKEYVENYFKVPVPPAERRPATEDDPDEGVMLFHGDTGDTKTRNFNLSVSVIESDESTKDKLLKASTIIEQLAGIGSVMPAHGASVTQGFNLISTILKSVTIFVKDRQEICYHGSVGRATHNVEGKELDGGPDIRSIIQSGTYEVTRKLKHYGDVSITYSIKTVNEVRWTGNKDRYEDQVTKYNGKNSGNKIEDNQFSVVPKDGSPVEVILSKINFSGNIIDRLKDSTGLTTLEFNVAGQGCKLEFQKESFKYGVYSINNFKIYEGKWQKFGLPISCSLVYIKDSLEEAFSALVNVYNSAVGFTKSVMKDTGSSSAEAEAILSATQTTSSAVAAGLTPSHEDIMFSLGSKLLQNEKEGMSFRMFEGKDLIGSIVAEFEIIPLGEVAITPTQ